MKLSVLPLSINIINFICLRFTINLRVWGAEILVKAYREICGSTSSGEDAGIPLME
jgi:hypothetical protein